MTIKHVEFGRLLQEKLNSTKDYTVESIARRTGTPTSTIYKYCEGVLVTPAEFVSKVYNATGEEDFLNFIIGDTDKVLIDRHRGKGDKTVLEETLDVAAAAGNLVKVVQTALKKDSESGKKTSPNEKKQITKCINKTIKELEDLRTRSERT